LETLKYSKMYKSILSNFDVGLSQIELRISASLQFQEACTAALEIADLDKLITRHDEPLWRRENELLYSFTILADSEYLGVENDMIRFNSSS